MLAQVSLTINSNRTPTLLDCLLLLETLYTVPFSCDLLREAYFLSFETHRRKLHFLLLGSGVPYAWAAYSTCASHVYVCQGHFLSLSGLGLPRIGSPKTRSCHLRA